MEARRSRRTTDVITLAVGAAAIVALLLATRHWNDVTSTDLGFMSQKWLAEYNSQHP
jgi:hypothetical protein